LPRVESQAGSRVVWFIPKAMASLAMAMTPSLRFTPAYRVVANAPTPPTPPTPPNIRWRSRSGTTGRGGNRSTRAHRYRQRIAKLSGKQRNSGEPVDLELIVLFMSVGAIILIPWLFHDVRFILLVPITFLVVPGLFGVLLKAMGEFFSIVAESRREEKEERDRALHQKRVHKRQFHTRRRQSLWMAVGSTMRAASLLARGFVSFWRGFL
jgi:hypothetical protein